MGGDAEGDARIEQAGHRGEAIIAAPVPEASVFIGGVEISRACLTALCEMGRAPALAIGYDASKADASGYADLGDVCRRFDVPLVRTADVNAPEVVDRIRSVDPAVLLVVGWSQLVRRELLDVPRHGSVGLHPTRLPEGRGRAPIPWTIIKGLTDTACTLFYLTEGVDDGDIVAQVEVPLDPREDAGTLYEKHLHAHVRLLCENIDGLLSGTAPRIPQDHDRATYWPRRRPEDGRIDPSRPAVELDRLVRAVTRPFPGAFIDRDGGRLVIWRAEPAASVDAPPGAIVERDDGPVLACGEGSLRLLETDPAL